MQRFKGKTLFVPGAGQGLGEAIGQRFHEEGANVVAVDINDSTLATVWPGDERSTAVVADVTQAEAIQAAVDKAVERFGRIDILANVAGIALEQPFVDISEADWRRVIDVNLTGTFLVGQAVARQMIRQSPAGGAIVNMASKNGIAAEVKYAHYNASKAGVILLTKTMAADLADHGIRVNAVAPGYCRTPLTAAMDPEEFQRRYAEQCIPLNRLGKPEEVAGLFAFLASEDAGFVTGETILMDGGQLAIDGRKFHAWDDI